MSANHFEEYKTFLNLDQVKEVIDIMDQNNIKYLVEKIKFTMKIKIWIVLMLGIGSLHLKAQRYVSTPLKEHQSYFAGLVEKRKGNCDLANHFFNKEKSDKTTMNHDHWKDKAENQMVVCSDTRNVSVTSGSAERVKLRKPRIFSQGNKNIVVAAKSDPIVEKKPKAEKKKDSYPVANTKPHYRIKIEESSQPNKSFISMADLGPVYTEEVNGKFAYYIASSNKEEKIFDLASKITDRINREPAIEQCDQGKVVKSYTVNQFAELPAIKKLISDIEKKKEPVKTEEMQSNSPDNNVRVSQPYVVVESLSESNKAEILKARLDKMEYITVTEKNGKYTRVGVIPKENQSLDALLEELRKNVNAKAWIRR